MKRVVLLILGLVCGAVQAAQSIETWTLPNGARVLLVENHSIPMLDISISFDAGARRDPHGKPGLASIDARHACARGWWQADRSRR